MDSITDDDKVPLPIITDQAFQSFADIIQLLSDPVQYGQAVTRCKAAIADLQKVVADVRKAIAEIPPVDQKLAEHDAAIERWKKAKADIEELKPRRDRITALIMDWRDFGEEPDVIRGFKAPAAEASTKARRAAGLPPWAPKSVGFGVNSPGDIAAREQAAQVSEQAATERWRESVNVGAAPYNPSQFRFDAVPTDISVRTPTKFSRRKHRRPRELK